MIPKTLTECKVVSYKLDQLKDLHEFAIKYKDKPAILWGEATGGIISTCGFLAPAIFLTHIQWTPEWATRPITPFAVYVMIGIMSAIVTGFIANRTIKFLTKNKPTWVMKFEEELSRYTPIDKVAFQRLQNSARLKGFIEKVEFENWFDAESKAFGAHTDYLAKLEGNVNLRSDGPFLSRHINQQ
jgi:hypothetical protein